MNVLETWLNKIGNLKRYTSKGGPAPHKPLLLLVVLDSIENQGLPSDGLLELTPELAFRFSAYASVVAHRRSQPILVRFPFYHLKNDGFWQTLDDDRQTTTEKSRGRFAALNPVFADCAQNPDWRTQARQLLIAKYFQPEERAALYSLTGLPVPEDAELKELLAREPLEVAFGKGREARFRIIVLYNYHFSCALSGYRLTTIDSGCIVDAAHIHQFADSRNNDPRNGLALSKNAHWLFDNGLWTLDGNNRVLVAQSHFAEEFSDPAYPSLSSYHGRELYLPADPASWPAPHYVEWHRTKRFRDSKN